MTAHQRQRRSEKQRRDDLPRVPVGYDPRGRAIVMRRLHSNDLTKFSAATRRQLADIGVSQTWHGDRLTVSGQTFGIFIGGQFAGAVELHTPTVVRAVARVSYWMSAAFACWGVASQAVTKFIGWAAASHGIELFEVRCRLEGQITSVVVDRALQIAGDRRYSYAVCETLSSA